MGQHTVLECLIHGSTVPSTGHTALNIQTKKDDLMDIIRIKRKKENEKINKACNVPSSEGILEKDKTDKVDSEC